MEEEALVKKKQKGIFGMPATEMRLSINDYAPFKILDEEEEEGEEVNGLDETKVHQESFKKQKTD